MLVWGVICSEKKWEIGSTKDLKNMHWQQHARRLVKMAVVWPAHYSGVLSLARRLMMRRRGVILMYHRVIGPETRLPDYSPNGMAVTAQQFARQMQFIASRYQVVPLQELVTNLQRSGREFRPNLCAITFDDGWRDVYDHAYPILRQYSLPATVFLTTNFVDQRPWFWEERAKFAFAHIWGVLQKPVQIADPTLRQDLETCLNRFPLPPLAGVRLDDLPQYLGRVVRLVNEWQEPDRARWMSQVESVLTREPFIEPRQFLNWEEIREMAGQGIEVGNHTVTHHNLAALPEAQARAELSGAADRIRERLGRPVRNIAYPYGKHAEGTKRIAAEMGAASACTTRLGLVKSGDDLYSLKRINVHSDVSESDAAFAARLLNL